MTKPDEQQKHVEKAWVTGTTPTRPYRIHFINEEARVAYKNIVVFIPKHVRFIPMIAAAQKDNSP